MKPGELLQEGVVVKHDDAGVWVGREAENDRENCPPGHTEHNVGGRRVFLANAQAPIAPARLHSRKSGKKDE